MKKFMKKVVAYVSATAMVFGLLPAMPSITAEASETPDVKLYFQLPDGTTATNWGIDVNGGATVKDSPGRVAKPASWITPDTESGNTESGNTESGNTESGNTESGNTESGNTEDSDTLPSLNAGTGDWSYITINGNVTRLQFVNPSPSDDGTVYDCWESLIATQGLTEAYFSTDTEKWYYDSACSQELTAEGEIVEGAVRLYFRLPAETTAANWGINLWSGSQNILDSTADIGIPAWGEDRTLPQLNAGDDGWAYITIKEAINGLQFVKPDGTEYKTFTTDGARYNYNAYDEIINRNLLKAYYDPSTDEWYEDNDCTTVIGATLSHDVTLVGGLTAWDPGNLAYKMTQDENIYTITINGVKAGKSEFKFIQDGATHNWTYGMGMGMDGLQTGSSTDNLSYTTANTADTYDLTFTLTTTKDNNNKINSFTYEVSEKAASYTITYVGDNNSKNPTTYSVPLNTAITLKAPAAKTGYTFAGWYTANTGGTKVTAITAGSTGNKTFYARWTATKYTITYKLNSGKNVSGNPASYYVTSNNITLKAPTRTGYTFAGWYTANKGGTKVTAIAKGSTGNKTLYARWTAKKYTIKYNANGGKVKSPSKSVTYGSKYATLQTPTRNGYIFTGWYTAKKGGTKITSTSTVKITKTTTLYARWAKKYTIKYNANSGKVKSSSKSVGYGTKYGTLQSPTRKGYAFAGWYTAKKGGKKITASSTVKIKKTTTLYARWKKVTVSKATIKKLSVPAKKQLKVTINKVNGAVGYEVVYSTKSNFKSSKKTTTTSTSAVIKNLVKGKTYHVKVRAFKKDSAGKKVYGKYSAAKKLKVTK